MSLDIPVRITEILARAGIPYEIMRAPIPAGLRNVLCATLLRDDRGYLLAVYPQSHVLDVAMLNGALSRTLCPALLSEVAAAFPDCAPQALPPFGAPYGVETCVDRSVDGLQLVLCETGSEGTHLQLSGPAFVRLLGHATRGLRFALENQRNFSYRSRLLPIPRLNLAARLQLPAALPTTPERARRLLALRGDEHAGPHELEYILRDDPSTSAQILRYANSPFLGHVRQIGSLEHAIVILGYEVALHIATGVAMAQALRMQPYGPLTVEHVWQHAVYAAIVCEQLAPRLPATLGVQRGPAYLSGLLQDIGYVYLACTFNKEMCWLNQQRNLNPHSRALDVEREVLGITHTDLGAMLLRRWGLPEEIVVAVEQHENPEYSGPHQAYPYIVVVANYALAHYGVGEAADEEMPETLFARLSMDRKTVMACVEPVLRARAALDGLVRTLGA